MFMFRARYVVRENPWARALLGVVMILAGVIWVIVGAGHGRLAAVGALLLVGGVASGIRGLRIKRTTERQRQKNENESPAS
jgi:uncharacterized membrane protein HdeD (DUF308 family)